MNTEQSTFKKITGNKLFLPVFCLILVLIINEIVNPSFFAIKLQDGVLFGIPIDILNRASGLVVLALGMTLTVASSAGTDISVGAVSALTGAIMVQCVGTGDTYKMPWIAAAILAIIVGCVCGAWNGFLVSYLKIQPMVATLILYTAGRGMAQIVTGSFILQQKKVASFSYMGTFLEIGGWKCPIPTPVFVAAIMVALTVLMLTKTAMGLYIQSVGINSAASRLVGLNSKFIAFLTYVFCGFCAAINGMISTSRTASIDANNVGLNQELDAILAVAIGGNSLGGGKFSIAGSVIGAVTIQALTTSLYSMSVSSDRVPLVKAIVVVIIVSLQSPELGRMYRSFKAKRAQKGVA